MACVSSMMKMGMKYVRCDKCHEITWCTGSITEGCAVCLKCANLSSDNIANIEKKLQELDNSTAQGAKENTKCTDKQKRL